MLQNMKLGFRLGLGFAVVLVLLVIASGIGVTNLSDFKEIAAKIVGWSYPKVQMVNDVIKNTLDNGRQVRNIALSTNQAEIDEYFKKMDENRKKNGELLEKLDKQLTLPKGRELFKVITDKRAILGTKYTQMGQLVKAGDRQALGTFIKQEFGPANNAFWEALEAMATFQAEQMDKQAKQMEEAYICARNILVGVSLFAVVIGTLVGVWITRSVMNQLGGEPAYAAECVKKIAAGTYRGHLQIGNLQGLFRVRPVEDNRVFAEQSTGADLRGAFGSQWANGVSSVGCDAEGTLSFYGLSAQRRVEVVAGERRN